jgi:CelD/BcsL family acetyltransferase involved in cellulose biosynthesis
MIERISIDDWRSFDAAHPAPTLFARPMWAMALSQVFPGMQPAPLRLQLEVSRPVIVPLMQMPGGPLRWREYCGFPQGGYTCFMHEDGTLADDRTCATAVRVLARFADVVTLFAWPLGPQPAAAQRTMHQTDVVDLRDGVDAALANVDGKFRRMAGQAERRGVSCAPSRENDAVDRYYALLEASARRWGLAHPTIPKPLIAALVAQGGSSVEIWFARADDRDIAGGIVFYGSQEFFFWSAAMLGEYSQLRPSNALNLALMRAACERGMLWYNLGSSEGLPGVARFKDHLGAREISYAEVRTDRVPYRLYTNVRRALTPRASV